MTDTANPNPDTSQALVAGVREAYEASTQGEWVAKVQSVNQGDSDEDHMTLHFADIDWMTFYEHEDDALFIALAHNAMPAILDHLATVERDLSDLRPKYAALAEFVEWVRDNAETVGGFEMSEQARHQLAKLAEGKT